MSTARVSLALNPFGLHIDHIVPSGSDTFAKHDESRLKQCHGVLSGCGNLRYYVEVVTVPVC